MTEIVRALFDLDATMLTALGYKLSYLEFAGTASGLVCVWLTARENVWCWPAGIINAACFFAMFFQLRLYSDMFLQVYFFATSIYGWWQWLHPGSPELANRKNQLKITTLSPRNLALLLAGCAAASAGFGLFISHVHQLLPALFPERAAFPYADSVVAVASVAAQWIMARKKLECWPMWVGVDVLAAAIYFMKGVNLVAVEYVVFGCIAAYGFWGWRRERRAYAVSG
jgi:nicotinamide mononucleotide transporter